MDNLKMDQVASIQTEKIASYENSRTKRSLIDDSDNSNNDDEFATSGFYVREKTASKDSSVNNAKSDIASNDKQPEVNIIENGIKNIEEEINNGSKGQKKDEDEISTPKRDEEEASIPKGDEGHIVNPEGVKGDMPDTNINTSVDSQDSNNDSECNNTKPNDLDGSQEASNDKTESSTENIEESRITEKKVVENAENEVSKEHDSQNKDPEVKDNVDEKQTENILDTDNKSKKKEDGSEKNKVENSTEETDKIEEISEVNKDEQQQIEESKDKEEKNDKNSDVKKTEKKTSEKSKNGNSILKEHLTKTSSFRDEAEGEEDMDIDLDPSLLCPDISMDIEEAPVITNDNSANDGNLSPLPYEASFSTLVDEVTGAEVIFDLTPEEMELRSQMYSADNPVQYTKIHCTACNVHLGSALDGQKNRFVHPLLKVLICKNCYHFYTSGEFEKDEDGSELYCRWCGQGGEVLCCSSCEFVFCKRCIRNNFGIRRFKDIRNSDDWNCYRCNPGQLSRLRAACAEFIDYYRTELASVSSLAEKMPELMTTDYTKCCSKAQKKSDSEKQAQEPRKRKRKDSSDDPDYHPVLEEEPPRKKTIPAATVVPTTVIRPSVAVGKPAMTTITTIAANKVQPGTSGQVFRVGNTTFRAKAPAIAGYTVTRPAVQTSARLSSPGYIKILPQRMVTPRPQSTTYTVVSGNAQPKFTTVRPQQKPQHTPTMKHEWFEKTVRAAARVNSNLSYTLTQLNRQQSQASNVEALAVVHNKLQEVLSTSINSLIQIRKNLRTEFIAGIKNFKFPPKPLPPAPSSTSSEPITIKDDDDVIIVTPPTAITAINPPPLILSPNVTLTNIKKSQVTTALPQAVTLIPSTSLTPLSKDTSSVNTPAPPIRGGYLKVKSFSALQNVSSDCITIPDDPSPKPDTILDEKTGVVMDMGEPSKVTAEVKKEIVENKKYSAKKEGKSKKAIEGGTDLGINYSSFTYNVKEKPSPLVKKMLQAVVVVKRSRAVDEIIRAKEKLSNGDG